MKQHNKHDNIKIGISHGDINGIGYEVILKTLQDPRILEMCTPIVYGSPKVAAYHRKALNINDVSFNHIKNTKEAFHKKANIINCVDEQIRVELGKSTEEAGLSSYNALEKATSDLQNGLRSFALFKNNSCLICFNLASAKNVYARLFDCWRIRSYRLLLEPHDNLVLIANNWP